MAACATEAAAIQWCLKMLPFWVPLGADVQEGLLLRGPRTHYPGRGPATLVLG
ncbi:hypothetical protein F444_22342 [Phytophthora nicotianae P1976]|uniref:Uncharacterized protein n=1 Tax=Phytophthora nicotianae P1976 TaxID=1317066 RepID=A0A080YY26_PHYNI|nr:hypothetical protein F444_22342 [Phytophthora nicotianae P1976]